MVDDPDIRVNIMYHLFPWARDQPVMLRMASTPDLFLPLFSTMEKLTEIMRQANIPYEAVKQVHSPRDFIRSLPAYIGEVKLRIIVDPTLAEGKRVRYTEVYRAIH